MASSLLSSPLRRLLSRRLLPRAVSRAWRRARHGVFAWTADAYARGHTTYHTTHRMGELRLFAHDMVRVLVTASELLAPLRTQLAWHRSRYAAACRAGEDLYPHDLPLLRPLNALAVDELLVRQLLSARLPIGTLATALQSLRAAGRYPAPIFHRALARLDRTADGQVNPLCITGIPRRWPWGEHNQTQLGLELAQWAVTRSDWRRDPRSRVLLTDPAFTAHAHGRSTAPAIQRLLTVALDAGTYPTDAERARALVDAFTWPEFAETPCPFTEAAVRHAVALGPFPREVLQQLTPEDLGALLASPFPAVRTWVLTTVLPAQDALAALPSGPPGPVVGDPPFDRPRAPASAAPVAPPPRGALPVRGVHR